ncbi:hypothetical protein L1987_88670 [Smallanthus sonchifolius]|nr:hypothetical protein L1987_88670 [Smallanthus sonchifolius]
MRTVQEAADQTLSSVPGFISTLGQSYHSPDGMGCRHVYWSSWEEHRPLFFFQSLEKGAWSAMFPTYPLVIPMIPRCTYSPQPSVQIYLGYGHCTPIVVSPISASVGGTYDSSEMAGGKRGKVAAKRMVGAWRMLWIRAPFPSRFPVGGELKWNDGDWMAWKAGRVWGELWATLDMVQAGWSGLCPSEFYPRYHKGALPSHRSRVPSAPQLSKNGENSRERRDKKREGSAETQVPLPELPEPEVEVEGLLSEKKRQMIRTVVALAEQGAYREDWGNEEFDDLAHRLHLSLKPTSESSTESHNQPDPPKPKKFPLDRMRLSLRDPLVIGPPLLAKKERQVQAIDQKKISFPFFMTEQLNAAVQGL